MHQIDQIDRISRHWKTTTQIALNKSYMLTCRLTKTDTKNWEKIHLPVLILGNLFFVKEDLRKPKCNVAISFSSLRSLWAAGNNHLEENQRVLEELWRSSGEVIWRANRRLGKSLTRVLWLASYNWILKFLLFFAGRTLSRPPKFHSRCVGATLSALIMFTF